MLTETRNITAFTINAPGLDPILVLLQDFELGKGRLIVECFGSAWSIYWGGMGEKTLRQFIVGADTNYIAGKLWPVKQRRTKRDMAYLERIVGAVRTALAQER